MGIQKGRLAGDKNPAWRGGHAGYRGPSWKRQRELALERDGYACRSCGTKDKLTVNHIKPFRLFSDHETANMLNNLVTLCRPCHSRADNAAWKECSHLIDSMRSAFPDCRIMRTCRFCGSDFEGTPMQTMCSECRIHKCEQCGKTFSSAKRRAVRFCSVECNVAYRKSVAKWPRKCLICGKKIGANRLHCRDCWTRDPSGLVRPGHKIGRPPKDRLAA